MGICVPEEAEVELQRAFSLAATAWPTIGLCFADFAEFMRRHSIGPNTSNEINHDLFLACACGLGDPSALQHFRDRYFGVVATAVRSLDASPQYADEIFQRLQESLFVSPPGTDTKIQHYRGQGPLAGFVRTVARRIGMRVTAAAARFQGEEALAQEFSRASELEATVIKLQCRDAINRALCIALSQLPRRERLILRMNLVEKVSTTRIAAMYKVSQPTVSRWIQRSARAIQETVKVLVCDELDIDARELDSLLQLVRSQIEITISRGSSLGSPPSA
jgi:RNA polymerase sigma-70 factor (ECF subfamily)